jgi:hypothetical protein
LGIVRVACRLNVGNQSPEALWGHQEVALDDEPLDLVPIDGLEVEPETDQP